MTLKENRLTLTTTTRRAKWITGFLLILTIAFNCIMAFNYYSVRNVVHNHTPKEFPPKLRDQDLEYAIEHPLVPTAQNRTPENTKWVIYNRIPKAGSTTAIKIIERLSNENNFVAIDDISGELGSTMVYTNGNTTEYIKEKRMAKNTTMLNITDAEWYGYGYPNIEFGLGDLYLIQSRCINGTQYWKQIVSQLANKTEKSAFVFIKHVYHFNVTENDEFPPYTYINMVREPVARFVSFFYARKNERFQNNPSDGDLNKCVHSDVPYCHPRPGVIISSMVSYFCGIERFCFEHNNPSALRLAKRHLEEKYSVVGALEYLDLSLRVFEAYLPAFFKDVTSFVDSSGCKME